MTTKDWIRFWALGIVWGTSFLWIKVAVAEVSPVMLVSFRTLFGALGLAAVLAWTNRRTAPAGENTTPQRNWRSPQVLGAFALLGLFNVAVPFVLISWAEQFIDSGLAALLNATVPLFTIIIAGIALPDDKFTFPKVAGLGVGFLGVTLLLLPDLQHGVIDQSLLGQGAMLLATLSYAGASVYARHATKGLAPTVQSMGQVGFATLIMWLLTLFGDRPLVFPSSPLVWFALLWLGLLGSCVAYLLFFALLHSVGPTRTVLVTYVLPLVGVILGALFLGERLYWQALVGGALIISGIALVNMKQLPFQKKETPYINT